MSLIWGSGRNKNNEKQNQDKNATSQNIKANKKRTDTNVSDKFISEESDFIEGESIEGDSINKESRSSAGYGHGGINSMPDIELSASPSQTDKQRSNVVDLSERRILAVADVGHSGNRRCSSKHSTSVRSSTSRSPLSTSDCSGQVQGRRDATILQFRGRAEYIAAIEIDDFMTLKMLYSDIDLQLLLDRMGYLLKREFGEQAVSRKQREFQIQFDDFELLVGGLLRAQFYAYKVDLPTHNIFGEVSDQTGLLLTWGIGNSDSEAHSELVKKKRYKQQRRRSKRKRKPLEPV